MSDPVHPAADHMGLLLSAVLPVGGKQPGRTLQEDVSVVSEHRVGSLTLLRETKEMVPVFLRCITVTVLTLSYGKDLIFLKTVSVLQVCVNRDFVYSIV